MLEAHGIEVVGVASDGRQSIGLARELKPDVILMDIRMPSCDGLTATRAIKAEMPDARIIILTTSNEDGDLFEAIKSGACGYLLKSIDTDELVAAIDQARQGAPPFSPGLAAKLLKEFARIGRSREQSPAETVEEAPRGELKPRQIEILRLLAEGLSYKEVGARLFLSPRTIKYHMAEIMNRLHLENRAQVLAFAGRMDLTGSKLTK
jgi:two-component system NarL family response regulator